MKQIVVARHFLLIILLLIFSQQIVQAQSPIVRLNSLMVELWLEYDQPEVLVIYRGQLSPDTTLPATVTFPIPAYVDEMHAVAVEDAGELFNVNPETIGLEPQEGQQLLSFQVTAPGFQFEYYDPEILTRQDQLRRLDYTFTTAHPIDTLVLEVQEPAQAQNFSMTPEPEQSFAAQNSLPHHTIRQSGLAAGQTVELTASYSRPTDALSAGSAPGSPPTEEPLDIAVISGSPISESLSIGYILLGAGLLLLLGTGGYWWWSRRSGTDLQTRHRGADGPAPGRLRKKKGNGQPTRRAAEVQSPRPAAASQPGGYCYRCGTALRPDAEFCHVCGTQRRRD